MPEEDKPIPPEPFIYEPIAEIAQEEAASPEIVPQFHPSPAPILEDPESFALAPVPTAPVLDLNEHAEDHL